MIIKEWLEHLDGSIPKEAYGYPTSMYSIALEGWRRGLTLRFENNNRTKSIIRYSLSDGNKTHYFMGSRGDLVTNEARTITSDKYMTKEYLSKAGVEIAEGKFFNKEVEDKTILDYALQLDFPLVIKPISGAGGRGVIANIQDENNFIEALHYVRVQLKYKDVIVERHINGDDYRVYVVGDKVIGAINRIPANVVGDGKKTISELIEEKNLDKKRNPAITDSPIRVDNELITLLKQHGYTLNSIPQNGERVFLKTKSNISAGGEPVDATDKLTEKVKINAVKAVQAIPGLNHGGVDVLWDSETDNMAILEVNNLASIRTHLFPLEGIARDVPKAIIDFYFPETKANHKSPLYYFDIGKIFEGFISNQLTEAVIPDHPKGTLDSKQYIIKNINKPLLFINRMFKLAKRLHLNGHIQQKVKNRVEIVVSGPIKELKQFEKSMEGLIDPSNISVKKWEKPIKIGFEKISSSSKRKGSNEVAILKQEKQRLIKERDFYRKKYRNIKNSRGWKLINLMRKIKIGK